MQQQDLQDEKKEAGETESTKQFITKTMKGQGGGLFSWDDTRNTKSDDQRVGIGGTFRQDDPSLLRMH